MTSGHSDARARFFRTNVARLIATISVAAIVGGLAACGGSSPGRANSTTGVTGSQSTSRSIPLTVHTTCPEWERAPARKKNLFAAIVASKIRVPSKYQGYEAAAYAYGFLGGRCNEAANPQQTHLGSIIAEGR
jgi:hypothetical protein